MSSVPVTPTTTASAQSEVSALAHKYLYAHLGILLLLAAIMCAGGYVALRGFNATLARAEAQEKVYQQDRTQWQSQVAQDAAERQAQALQIAALQAQISKRDSTPLPPAVSKGLQPNANATDANAALTAAYTSVPAFGATKVSPDGQNVLLSVPQAQQVIITQENELKDSADLKDEKSIVALQGFTITTLNTDLKGCQSTVSEANKTIADYKKAAQKSRFRKFLDGAEKVGLVLTGVGLGHMMK